MSSPPVRTALIGYGLAGASFHAPAITETAGLALTMVVTGSDERAARARERHPDTDVVASVDEVWARAADLDLVVIASPNRSHLPLALRAIESGLAVVIDKPVTATADDARTIRDAAAAANVPVSVYHNRRFDGSSVTVQRLVTDGALGTVHRFEARFDRWRPVVDPDAWREGADPRDAGGLLYDLGSHLIDQALTLFGPVSRVYAEVRNIRDAAIVDDDCFVALTHAGGTVSHLWASSVSADLGPWLRVLGSAGAYVQDAPDPEEPARRAGVAVTRNAGGRVGTPGDVRAVPMAPGSYADYYAALRDALLGAGPLPVTIEQAIDVMVVVEAAQRSQVEGVTVRL